MTYTLLGRKTVTTKTGRKWYTYYFSTEFTDYEKENSEQCLGSSVLIEGSGTDFVVNLGDVCELSYAKGFQDKAVLSGIHVVDRNPFDKKTATK